jgi:hypothetical protein
VEGVQEQVLRKIFEPKREGVIKGWRKLHTEKLQNSSYQPYKFNNLRRIRWAGQVYRVSAEM